MSSKKRKASYSDYEEEEEEEDEEEDEELEYNKSGKKPRQKEYIVEKIIGKRIRKGDTEYLVRWEGYFRCNQAFTNLHRYTESDDSWVSIDGLSACLDLIEEYEKQNAKQDQMSPTDKKWKNHKHAELWEHNNKILKDMEQTYIQKKLFLLKHRNLFVPFVNKESLRVKKLGIFSLTDEQAAAIDNFQFKVDAEPLTSQPSFIVNGKLRDYQLKGINWLIKQHDFGIPAILGDEMGLGKTIQTISLLAYLKFVRGEGGPHLIIAPLSVIHNWAGELQRWCPSLKVLLFHGNKAQREMMKSELLVHGKFDVCVTNFHSLMSETLAFAKFVWRYIIIDEAHCIKNENTLLSSIVRRIRCAYRVLLTGTPLQNNLHELWSLLNFMFPDLFEDPQAFDQCFDLQKNVIDKEKIAKVSELLVPFMLRRLKTDVELTIPPKTEIKIYVPLSELQVQCYKSILSHNLDLLQKFNKELSTNPKEFTYLLNLLMQLRKACLHPYLFDIEPEPFTPGEHLIKNSSKMALLDKLLPKLKQQGSKVLLFSQFTRMMDILEDYLNYRGYTYLRLDGDTHSVERDWNIKLFGNDSVFIFLISTRAGGLGLNLTAADCCILFDSDWNPHVDMQAQARCHRIGQTKPVKVYRLIAEGTVEERMVQRAMQKLFLDAAVMHSVDAAKNQEKAKGLSVNEMLSMVKFGASKIVSSKGKDISDEDIDTILQRSEQKSKDSGNLSQEDMEFDINNFQIKEEDIIPLRRFEGVDHTRSATNDVTETWKDLGKRKRKQRKLGQELDTFTDGIELKKREKVVHEAECFVCKKSKPAPDMECRVNRCTKSYHEKCVDEFPSRTSSIGGWTCPWHVCFVCNKTSTEVGGYMFKCHTCPVAYCDACLPHNEIQLVGKYSDYQPHVKNVMYIVCLKCCTRTEST